MLRLSLVGSEMCIRDRFDNVGSEHELCSVWLGRVDVGSVVPNSNEISEVQWISSEGLSQALIASPDDYTPWLRMEWSRLVQEFSGRLP